MYFSEFGAALCGDGPLCVGMARSCAAMALVLHTSGNRSPCADISSDVRGWCHLMRRWSDLCSDGLKSCGAGCSSQSYTYSFSIVNKQVKEMSQLGMKKRNPRRSTWVSPAGRAEKVGGYNITQDDPAVFVDQITFVDHPRDLTEPYPDGADQEQGPPQASHLIIQRGFRP